MTAKAGFYKMHRGWQDNPVFRNEPYSRRAAWVWLIEKTAWKDTERFTSTGRVIPVARGQIHTSERTLGGIWGWSKNKVGRFLHDLETCHMVDRKTDHSGILLTIRNYAKYQDVRTTERTTERCADGPGTDQARTTQEERKEIKERKKDKGSGPIFVCPEGIDARHWKDFLANRTRKQAVNSETAYKRVLGDLEKHAHTGWTKDGLVKHAAEEGWKGIYFPNCDPPAAKTAGMPPDLQERWNDLAQQRSSGEIDADTYVELTAPIFEEAKERAKRPEATEHNPAIAGMIHRAVDRA